MCKFCEHIIEYDEWPDLDTPEVPFQEREKIILVNIRGKIRFYGFNKYHYEDDAWYDNIEVEFCPVCGTKLTDQ